MSIEQWGLLALLILPPLLAGVARLRRMHMSPERREPGGVEAHVAGWSGMAALPKQSHEGVSHAEHEARPPRTSLPPPLPERRSDPAVARVSPVASHRRFAQPIEGQASGPKSVHAHRVVQWVRPMHNLRRAIVVTTILTPRSW